jgi:hypothetical protein
MNTSPSSTTPEQAATVQRLVARSAELKRELVEFAQNPRFARRLDAQLFDAADPDGCLDEATAISVIDRFALQHHLSDGRTVLERFVAQRRPPLADEERQMLLSWQDVIEAAFEVQRLDGQAVVLLCLFDDLVYRVHSNVGRRAFAQLRKGMFVVCRIVPVHPDTDAWLISGHLAAYPKSAARQIAQATARTLTGNPHLLRRNPDRLRRGWQLQAEDRAAFVELAGSDLVILPPEQAQSLLIEHYRRRLAKTTAELSGRATRRARQAGPAPEELGRLPQELLEAHSVGIIYDETEGLNHYADLGQLDALFADPRPARDRTSLARLREYLNDDSVHPMVIRRLVARHPESADHVFRTLLRKPSFHWEQDGEQLLQRRKKHFFNREPMPSITPVGERLTQLLHAGR